MLIRHFLILGISLMTTTVFTQTQSPEFLAYINKYADLAVDEMERAGIPASIKLAQGLLESNAGRSYLARKGNNHFGIKCGGNWDGKTVYREDDDFDENGKLIKSCFRSYRNVRASYIAHSDFLRDPKKIRRYGFLFRLDPTDYRRWARGLKSAGYATSATYDKKLIRLIETYELHKYDTEATRIDPDTDILVQNDDRPRRNRTNTSDTSPRTNSVNDVRFVTARDGESVVDISERSQTAVSSLKKYNEKITDSSQRLKEGTRVFLQPKRNSYRGKRREHKIEKGETMFALSQRYGVKLSKLYKRNKMTAGQEPAVGALIVLKGKVKKRPPLSTEPIQEEEELILEDPETEEVTEPNPTETIPDRVPELEEPVVNPRPPAPQPQPPVEEEPEIEEIEELEEIEFEDEDIFEEEEEEEFLDPIDPPAPSTNPKEPFKPEKEETVPSPAPSPTTPTKVEEPKEEVKETPAPPKENIPANAVFYTVQRGDTLWGIARKFNSSVADIKRWNNLDSDYIRRGMRFRVK